MRAKQSSTKTRHAAIVTEAVSVLCPHCGEPQPNRKDGSELWTRAEFESLAPALWLCVACDEPMFVIAKSTAKVL